MVALSETERFDHTMQSYTIGTEQAMHAFFNTLNEKDRRCYAGVEALKLGHGGRNYIAQVLGCSRRLVRKGAVEISGLSSREVDELIHSPQQKRIRKPGGGRKSYKEKHPGIDERFLLVLRDHTAGDPMDEKVRWTDLSPGEITNLLKEKHNIGVSKGTVRKLLKAHDYRRRKAQKNSP